MLDKLKSAHLDCSCHRVLVVRSKIVGCFYCCETFPPSEIKRWIDNGQTALCPYCGIDSVLPDVLELTDEFLKSMREYWFNIEDAGQYLHWAD